MRSIPVHFRCGRLCLLRRRQVDRRERKGRRLVKLLEQGDMEGKDVWLRILKSEKELQNMEPAGPVH